MKVAELYAQLGIKVDTQDLQVLKEFETTLAGIATAAKNAAMALRELGKTPLSRGISKLAKINAKVAAPAGGALGGAASPVAPESQQAPEKAFAVALSKVIGNALLKTLGIATLAMSIQKLTASIKDSMRMAMQTSKTQRQTGMALASLRRYEYIGGLAGIEPQTVQETFQNFRQMFENLRETGTLSAVFAKLGMTVSDDAEAMFRSFFQATKNMDEGRAKYFASLLGISDDLLYAMRKFGDTEVPEGLTPTDAQISNLSNLNTEWNKLTKNLGLVAEQIVMFVAPALTKVLEIINGFVTWGATVRDMQLSGRTFMSQGGMGFVNPTMFSPGNAVRPSPTINNNVTQYLQGTGYSRADGQNMARAFLSSTDVAKAYFQSSGSFLAPTAVP